MSNVLNNTANLASVSSLPLFDTKKVVEYLKHDILVSLYRFNPNEPEHMAEFQLKLNEKIAATYKKWFGTKFKPKFYEKNGRPTPMFLFGEPGVGKTASYLAAAGAVAEDLELRLITKVTDNYVPKYDDLIVVVQETAGENSALTFGGVPKAEEVTLNGITETMLKKATNYRFNLFKHCAGGVVLFDDAANAASTIQNVLLPMAQFGTFQGLEIPNALVGFTGNYGALDNTYTTDQSSALLTRVYGVAVTDTPKNFIERIYAKYDDELGDLGYCNYIDRCQSGFIQPHEPGTKSGHACPRTHEDFIKGCRSLVARYGGRGVGEMKALPEMMSLAKSKFGHTEGTKVAAYLDSFMRGADPLAKQYILEGKPAPEEFQKQYKSGSGSDDLAFGYQFATACGDYAANFIAESDDKAKALEEAMKRFGTAVLQLNDTEFTFAIEHLKQRLSNVVPEFSKPGKYNRELTPEIREVIAVEIVKLDDCTQSHRDIIIANVTDFDKTQNANMFAKKKGGRSLVN